jgi:hypothetical protein
MAAQGTLTGGPSGGQTIPMSGGAGSQNLNPMGSSVFSTLAQSSPVSATLPQYPGMSAGIPSGIMGGGQTTPSGGVGGFMPGQTSLNAPTQQAGSFTTMGDLQATYGQGTGTAIGNLLGGLGTSTSQAEQLMIQPTLQAAGQQLANLQATQAAQGVDPASSAAALAAGDLSGQVTSAIAGEMGNIGLNEEQMLLGSLTGLGQAHGPDVSGWDTFGNVMQGIGQAGLQLGTAALLGPGAGNLTSMLGGLFGHSSGGAAAAASQGGISRG